MGRVLIESNKSLYGSSNNSGTAFAILTVETSIQTLTLYRYVNHVLGPTETGGI
jgi:hypothetical protein